MVNLGIVDLIMILLLGLMIYLASRRRGLGLAILIAALLLGVMLERLAPGTLASIASGIRGIDQVNAAGPHLAIQPIVRLQK